MPRPISSPESGSPSSRFLIHRTLPARSLLGLLICLLCWHGLAPWHGAALAAESPAVEWIRLDPVGWEPARQQPTIDLTNEAQGDVWLNATYAFGGSALSNGLIVLSAVLLGLILEATSPTAEPYLDIAGPGTIGLMVFSAAGTPLLMHLWSPEARGEYIAFSLIGSLAASGAVLLLMLPLGLLFNQNSFNDTFYLLLPPALITTVLLQGLGAAWGHELGENLTRDVNLPGSGGVDPLAARPASPQGIVLLNQRWSF